MEQSKQIQLSLDLAPAAATPPTAESPAPAVIQRSVVHRCPLCRGHLVDNVCDTCGMEVSL